MHQILMHYITSFGFFKCVEYFLKQITFYCYCSLYTLMSLKIYVCVETNSPIGVKYNNTESRFLFKKLLTGAFFQFSVPIWKSVFQNVLASHLKSKINVSQTLHMLLFLEFLKLLNQNTKPGPQKQNL